MDKKLSKSAQAFFDYFKKLERPLSSTQLWANCESMDRYEELAGNEEFKQVLISKKHYLLDDPTAIVELECGRETFNPPKSHFWWWIDEL